MVDLIGEVGVEIDCPHLDEPFNASVASREPLALNTTPSVEPPVRASSRRCTPLSASHRRVTPSRKTLVVPRCLELVVVPWQWVRALATRCGDAPGVSTSWCCRAVAYRRRGRRRGERSGGEDVRDDSLRGRRRRRPDHAQPAGEAQRDLDDDAARAPRRAVGRRRRHVACTASCWPARVGRSALGTTCPRCSRAAATTRWNDGAAGRSTTTRGRWSGRSGCGWRCSTCTSPSSPRCTGTASPVAPTWRRCATC